MDPGPNWTYPDRSRLPTISDLLQSTPLCVAPTTPPPPSPPPTSRSKGCTYAACTSWSWYGGAATQDVPSSCPPGPPCVPRVPRRSALWWCRASLRPLRPSSRARPGLRRHWSQACTTAAVGAATAAAAAAPLWTTYTMTIPLSHLEEGLIRLRLRLGSSGCGQMAAHARGRTWRARWRSGARFHLQGTSPWEAW
jgi:hypothetical protein